MGSKNHIFHKLAHQNTSFPRFLSPTSSKKKINADCIKENNFLFIYYLKHVKFYFIFSMHGSNIFCMKNMVVLFLLL